MTTYRRFLLSSNSTTTTTTGKLSPPSNSKSSAAEAPESVTVESDFVVILAALLCALICVVGLIAVARCAWLRRGPNNSNGSRSGRQPSANKGLKKKILQSLPKYIYDSASAAENGGAKSSDCAICLAEYVDGDEIRVLPQCGHGFHVLCIDTWLGSHSSCPSCRQILVVARCQKCGEFPAVSGVGVPAPASTDSRLKVKQDCVTASTSSTFLP